MDKNQKARIEFSPRNSISSEVKIKPSTSKIELLAPAGSLACLKAAVSSGADSVYLGLGKFNARESASNFSQEYFKEAMQICKSNGVKAYLTANTLVKNSEIDEFLEQIKYTYALGVQAVILQDPSFIPVLRKSFPKLQIHLSTQAGIMNSLHASLFDADRVILAREIDKKNLELLRKNTKTELEIFVHGALCACISGSCLFSSLLGGRSGNRGKCAQPCRKIYNNRFMLSSKELCLIERLPEIIGIGIDALKIEGRMRTPSYVSSVVSTYRKAMGDYYSGKFKVTPEMKKTLESAFTRGFTEGRFSGEEVLNANRSSGSYKTIKQIYGQLKTNPVKIERRESNLEIPKAETRVSSGKQLIVRVYNIKDALIAEKYADIICMDLFSPDFEKTKHKLTQPLYAVTPRMMFEGDLETIKKRLKEISPMGILAGNLGILKMNLDTPIILDYNSNCFNDIQLDCYEKMGGKPIISPELSFSELQQFKNKDFIVFAHGKIRLMTLAHELKAGEIKDEKGFPFMVDKIFNGSEIINGKELGFFNKIRNLMKAGINQFYIDTETNLEEVLKIYGDILQGKTIDASKLEKDYVLGWSRSGVL